MGTTLYTFGYAFSFPAKGLMSKHPASACMACHGTNQGYRSLLQESGSFSFIQAGKTGEHLIAQQSAT